jgi:hypothetical protein
VNLLEEWGLITLVNKNVTKDLVAPLSQIKIIAYSERDDWELVAKYNIGNKKRRE